MMKFFTALSSFFFVWSISAATPQATGVHWVRLPNKQLPIAAIHFTFERGSASDPQGEEGITYLMSALLREGGVKAAKLGNEKFPARDRRDIEEFLYPLAGDVQVSVRRDQTTFKFLCETSHCSEVLGILSQILTAPAFDSGEFDRLKTELVEDLERRAPREDEEELGKQALENLIARSSSAKASNDFWGYGHATAGRASTVAALKLARLKEFYFDSFLQSKLVVGVAGHLTSETEKSLSELVSNLEALKKGNQTANVKNASAELENHSLKMQVVEGPFEAVGMHLGMPISASRSHPDFAALFLVSQAFGKHRAMAGRLMQVVREERGLNYGTYSYVEELPDGGSLLLPPLHAARHHQSFTVWIRPTSLENACFAFRQVWSQVVSLAQKGITAREFAMMKNHLVGAVPLLALGLDRDLGFEMDGVFYGLPSRNLGVLQERIRKLSLSEVNRTLHKYISPQSLREMKAIVVSPDPQRFLRELNGESCPIHYPPGVEKSAVIKAEDLAIQKAKTPFGVPSETAVIKSEAVYQ